MTNSREMAEQAFALLQNALEESESQRLSLEQRLITPPMPEGDAEQSWQALHAELESVRTDRDLWKKTSSQLQDVVSNERSKVRRLTKKIRTTESGSDRNSRKEVNFWREKAEEFEATRQRYQKRIHELKSNLVSLEDQAEAAAEHSRRSEELERLEEVISERDAHLAELSAAMETARLRVEQQDNRISDLDSEVRSLSQQVIDAEAARNEACRATDQIDAELKDLRAQASTHAQTVEAMQQATDQAQSLNEEYRRRIDELELQHNREIDALRDGQVNELGAARAELSAQFDAQRNSHIGELDALRAAHAEELDALRGMHNDALQSLQSQLDEANSQAVSQETIDTLHGEHERNLQTLRDEHAAQLDAITAGHNQATEQLYAEHEESRQQQLAEQEQTLGQLRAEHEQALEQLRAENEQAQDHMRAEHAARDQLHESSLAQARAAADEATQEAEALRARSGQQLDELRGEFSQQIDGLESELAEERNRSDNLNELANERREALTKTTEKLEEMQERYEDAKWHLEKASHFQKLVKRRRKLIANLITTLRARQKANNTLKAGLDSLRRYKANADERQQELLRRTEALENSLSEAREKLAHANQARRASDAGQTESTGAAGGTSNTDAVGAVANTADNTGTPPAGQSAGANESGDTGMLRNQVMAQAEVIENLESDLKSARIAESDARNKLRDYEKLHDDLETKNTFIGTLQKDIEDQQKTLAKRRKQDIELRDLSSRIEQLQQKTIALTKENEQLRSAKNGEVGSIDQKKIAEQDAYIQKLTAKLKEYEASITTLSEAADSWKRKYDFLAAETPYAYESSSTK